MLELKNIVKEYPAGGQPVEALKGVSLQFRESEFVSILGPSGCGKTTLLNIIGGLDQYTSGDLVINGRSTKDYKDRTGTPTATTRWALCSKATTSSPTRRCCKTWSWP